MALTAALAWCGLLFGTGLDDLMNGHTRPGMIFSIVVLVVVMVGFFYVMWRPLRSRRRFGVRLI